MSGLTSYSQIAKKVASFSGNSKVFLSAVGLIAAWIMTGPLFHYSDTWQLVINTFTTIITFLMVFLIQNTQNRDTQAIQTKLDELIRATQGAHNYLIDLEDSAEDNLKKCHAKYQALANQARDEISRGEVDTGTPDA
ncbi:MAG: low affinity iron permease family protein [Candidatus Saccharibacteria bacterium]|nr:low affinity iron permease family protein [Moraxellaceae bacterium]